MKSKIDKTKSTICELDNSLLRNIRQEFFKVVVSS